MTEPAIMVIVGEELDFGLLQDYRNALNERHLYEQFGGRFLVARRPDLVLEGEYPEDRLTLVVEFPSIQLAHDFWYSETYQGIMKLRAGVGRFRVGIWKHLNASLAADRLSPDGMVSYMIVSAQHLQWTGYKAYLRGLRDRQLLERVDAFPLAGGPPSEVLEGDFPSDTNTVVLRFPTAKAVRNFWASPDYEEVREFRKDAGDLVVAVWDRRRV